MGVYEVLLGIDRVAKDTGRRMKVTLLSTDGLSAAIAAENIADRDLEAPAEYSHAMKVRQINEPEPAVAAMAA